MTFQGYPYLQKSSKKRYQELPTSGRPSQSHTSSTVPGLLKDQITDRFTIPYYAGAVRAARTEVKIALENCLRRLVMGQVVKPPASRVSL